MIGAKVAALLTAALHSQPDDIALILRWSTNPRGSPHACGWKHKFQTTPTSFRYTKTLTISHNSHQRGTHTTSRSLLSHTHTVAHTFNLHRAPTQRGYLRKRHEGQASRATGCKKPTVQGGRGEASGIAGCNAYTTLTHSMRQHNTHTHLCGWLMYNGIDSN